MYINICSTSCPPMYPDCFGSNLSKIAFSLATSLMRCVSSIMTYSSSSSNVFSLNASTLFCFRSSILRTNFLRTRGLGICKTSTQNLSLTSTSKRPSILCLLNVFTSVSKSLLTSHSLTRSTLQVLRSESSSSRKPPRSSALPLRVALIGLAG